MCRLCYRRGMASADVCELPRGFWEIGNYRHNVRRIKDGIDQLDDFSKMCKERAEIEAKYAKTLQTFNQKWRSHFEQTIAPCVTRDVLLQLVGESEALATLHLRAKDRLNDEILKTLALFRKENHHPSAFRAPKEIREIEEAFEKAQRQWKKLHEKTESAKKSYYSACRAERSAAVLLANAQQDTSVSVDAAQKMKDRCEKAHEEVRKSKQNYESLLQEINTFQAPYVENMSFVFAKCQQMELKRLKFFVEMITGVEHVFVDFIKNNRFAELHAALEHQLQKTNEQTLNNDLSTWSKVYGIDAPTAWPTFEEYRPEMREISARKNSAKDTGGVVLTRQVIKDDEVPISYEKHREHKKENIDIHRPRAGSSHASDSGKQGSSSDSDSNTFDSQKSNNHRHLAKHHHQPLHTTHSLTSNSTSNRAGTRTPDSEKFSEFDDYQKLATVLYDYSPIENDEIGLTKGETIEVLSEPDSLGWCTGRKNGNTGLFPASYVQVV